MSLTVRYYDISLSFFDTAGDIIQYIVPLDRVQTRGAKFPKD